MKKAITDYFVDEENHWVAILECGHTQHVRHNPPWQLRPWVITLEGRKSRIGSLLNCLKCDRNEPKDV